jgi:hypothetical protein
VTRLLWGLVAIIVGLGGYYLTLFDAIAWAGFVVLGVGLGIGAAVLGSLVHDALARTPGEKL